MESSHSMGGASTFITLSVHIYIIGLEKAFWVDPAHSQSLNICRNPQNQGMIKKGVTLFLLL